MSPEPAYPDAELVMLDLLAPVAAPGLTVTHTDEDLTPPAIRVARVGGTDDGVTDHAIVQTTCYGTTRQAAWALAELARQTVLGVTGGGVVTGDYVTDVCVDHTETVIAGRQLPYVNPDIRTVVTDHRIDLRRQY